jgi:SWI/SNF-related matrix-associated actin-dependent regulator of chromatin subfamily A protein 2/4
LHPGFEVISRDVGSDDDEADFDQQKQNLEGEKDEEFEGLDEEQRNKRIIEKARNEEDEYTNRQKMESYYATAHRIRERIVKQHSSLGEFLVGVQFLYGNFRLRQPRFAIETLPIKGS